MKILCCIRYSRSLRLVLPVAALLASGLGLRAVTFTNDTVIRSYNSNYDGMDVAVTNCTLTVDGVHSFASLRVLNGGNLTHSFIPSGIISNWRTIAYEPQILSATNVATLSNANVTASSIVVQDASGVLTYTNEVDYVIGLDTNNMTTLLLTTNSAIAEGSTNLVSYQYLDSLVPAGLSITVTGDVIVAQGATIVADGKGYDGGMGLGAGRSAGSPPSGSGAGYGGYGGQSAALGGVGSVYGVLQQPTALGSGGGTGYGGPGGAGGGIINLIVGGAMRVDGTVTANGANGLNERSGGGSGGSIWLSAQNFAGTGTISADGGAGEPSQGGGGGGGRISLQYTTILFSGVISARGGSGYVRGGAGTIYTRANGQSAGQVLVDNGGRTGQSTTLNLAPTEYFDLTAKAGAIVSLGSARSLGNLLVASNAWITFSNLPGTLTVTSNTIIQAGGGIIADGVGSAGGSGTGRGGATFTSIGYAGGGAGYGGYGATGGAAGAYGGITYGSLSTPLELGSGGGSYSSLSVGGSGGGAIRLNVTGMLLLDGRISADGNAGATAGGGGGSGGSVWLTVGTLAGAGTISANGGAGNGVGLGGGGGGGGGRVAINYAVNLFFGATSARGGAGAGTGGAGTIYAKANSQSWGTVVADNGGQSGTNTTWSPSGTVDLTVKGGAVVSPPNSQTFGSLLIGSNGSLSVSSQTLSVNGSATVQAGGVIAADGTGSPAGQGVGAGRYSSSTSGYIGGGGGYGGYGALGGSPTNYPVAYGGSTYGSVSAPTQTLGSGGGGYLATSGPSAVGGAGGGAVNLNVTGVLQVDGRISAAGGAGAGSSAGGGSGGSILLTVGTLAGSGVISANGGTGNFLGGGGGGGRIAITYDVNNFSGLVSAYGGGGYAIGGAGTIYSKARAQSYGLVLLDNGGRAGTNTTFGTSSLNAVDLTVRGGAVLAAASSYSWPAIGTLLVAQNGWIMFGGIGSSAVMTVNGSATIQAGGGLIADGLGNASGAGTGKYYFSNGYVGGGGGYGGYGAAGASLPGYSAYGGTTYGLATSPGDVGSGGGGYPNNVGGGVYSSGGAGGGAIRLTVTGTLEVDGMISARGLAGSGPSAGGGSGGSINLTVGTLSGSGVISANGGAGIALGGGGGGGRIAIAYTIANAFSGLVSAYGGSGYGVGGAGTVYITSSSGAAAFGPIIVDNGGQSGTNCGWPTGTGPTVDLTLRNGGTLSMPTSPSIVGNLLIGSNSWIYVSGGVGINPPTLTVRGNATIQAGGGIIADGGGYSYYNGGTGPGGGSYYSSYSGGGGFGGWGGASGGSTIAIGGHPVGLVSTAGPGSAGGTSGSYFVGGAGGGAISLSVNGTLQVDGRISSAGGPGVSSNAGGGSGGGIALNVGSLAGSGVIAANGGAGNGQGGGGGGGRIAVTYSGNTFSGLMSAYGGAGYNRGGAGTIYTKPTSKQWGQVVADNGGQAGAGTSWTSSGQLDVTVTGGAVVVPQTTFPVGTLLVTSNAWISVSNQMLTVTGNATVQGGGGIIADAAGNGSGRGQGAGRSASTPSGYVGGGGAYGGYGAAGGAPAGYQAGGGMPYGSLTTPTAFGSGGGWYTVSTPPGSAGGAAVRMTVTGALVVNGRISANGGDATFQNAGGGSGGSVWLTTGTLAGAGTISANGGSGTGLGGGGSGGCIALQYSQNLFSGLASAGGGGGYAWGGAGTIYTKANNQVMGQVLVDNGGHSGTNTPIAYSSPFDLTIRGGAVAHPGPSPASSVYLQLSNLVIGSGGTLTCLPTQPKLDLSVLRNVTIDSSGAISADGKGFGIASGPGAGHTMNSIGSGAGYGGNGGASSLSPGGATYGSAQQPVDRGSGGGSGWQGTAGGGEGGGALRVTVGGALVVNGRISAGGNPATQDDGGGGSGGSIWVTAGALVGNGVIAANGGAGELYNGGGGGGGRVAIYAPVNAFSGLVAAAGGVGFFPGQDGSVYASSIVPPPQVLGVDPTGVLNFAVNGQNITFNTAINPASVSAAAITLTGPGGVVVSNFSVSVMTPYVMSASFAQQTAQGDYAFTVGPGVLDLLGEPMLQTFTNTFSIVWSMIQGTVTDTNGLPVAGVVIQPDGGVPSTTTDTNGFYSLSVPPTVPIVVAPTATNLTFVPSSLSFDGVSGTLTNQNFVAVSSVIPDFTTQVLTNNLIFSWYGTAGVAYQPLCSSNLVDWVPYNSPIPGTNGPLQFVVPLNTDPSWFFRVMATY